VTADPFAGWEYSDLLIRLLEAAESDPGEPDIVPKDPRYADYDPDADPVLHLLLVAFEGFCAALPTEMQRRVPDLIDEMVQQIAWLKVAGAAVRDAETVLRASPRDPLAGGP
jgi:hypothetical protein